MAHHVPCVSLHIVLPFHSPSRPAPTQKGSSVLPSPYLMPGDQGRWDFSRASGQCLKRLICFYFLVRGVREVGGDYSLARHPLGAGAQSVMLHYKPLARSAPPGHQAYTRLCLFISNMMSCPRSGSQPTYGQDMAMKRAAGRSGPQTLPADGGGHRRLTASQCTTMAGVHLHQATAASPLVLE